MSHMCVTPFPRGDLGEAGARVRAERIDRAMGDLATADSLSGFRFGAGVVGLSASAPSSVAPTFFSPVAVGEGK